MQTTASKQLLWQSYKCNSTLCIHFRLLPLKLHNNYAVILLLIITAMLRLWNKFIPFGWIGWKVFSYIGTMSETERQRGKNNHNTDLIDARNTQLEVLVIFNSKHAVMQRVVGSQIENISEWIYLFKRRKRINDNDRWLVSESLRITVCDTYI